jgi:hypothetical protein
MSRVSTTTALGALQWPLLLAALVFGGIHLPTESDSGSREKSIQSGP